MQGAEAGSNGGLAALVIVLFIVFGVVLIVRLMTAVGRSTRKSIEKTKAEQRAKEEQKERLERIRELERKSEEANRKETADGTSVGNSENLGKTIAEAVLSKADGSFGGRPTKCPQCGGALPVEGKFCTFCGTPIPDNTIRAEVTIEDKARIKELEQAGKFVTRMQGLSQAYKTASQATAEAGRKVLAERRVVAEENRLKAEIKAEERRLKLEEKKIEKELRDKKQMRILMIILGFCIVALIILGLISKMTK